MKSVYVGSKARLHALTSPRAVAEGASATLAPIRDVAAQLKFGATPIYKMAKTGNPLGVNVRRQRWFRRSGIDPWVAAQIKRAKARRKDGGGDA